MKTPRQLVAGFSVLARVHDALGAASLPPDAHSVRWTNHIDAATAASAVRQGADRIRSWAQPDLTRFADAAVDHVDAVASLERACLVGLRRQVVHGDYWDNNVLFSGDRISAVLDFGFMAERTRIDDLALPIWFHLLEPGQGRPTPSDVALVRTMVDAYDAASAHPLSDAERQALPLAVARQPAWSVGRWVLALDEPGARTHARAAALELPVAQTVLEDLDAWQDALHQH